MSDVKRFVVIRHPDGIPPGTYFPEEYEGTWWDREECGLNSRVLIISPQVLCFPVGIKFRRSSDGAIADVYEPRGAPPLEKRAELEAYLNGQTTGGDPEPDADDDEVHVVLRQTERGESEDA